MSTIAQTSPSPPVPASPIPHSLFEGGIAVAIVIFIVKEATALFKKKDEDEAKLTSTLIEDLRNERSEQLQQMQTVLFQLRNSHQQLAIAIQKMSIAISEINTTHQQQARTNTEVFAQLRQHERILIGLSEKLERLDDARTSRNSTPQPQSRPHV